jgi:FixJ family two-component response regulator
VDVNAPLIVVIDDNQAIRALVSRAMSGVGYRVKDWANPESALADLRASTEKISLAVIDGVMPQMLGTSVADSLQDLQPDLPILLMSGHEAPMFKDYFSRPRRHFIAKPFVIEDFLLRAAGLIKR